jgi:hypothetical protein
MSNPKPASAIGSRAIGAGLTLAVSVGLFAYGGLWLDRRLDSSPPELWPFGKLPRNGPPASSP